MPDADRPHTPCPTVPGSPNTDYRLLNEHRDYDPYHDCKIDYLVGLDQDLKEATYVVYLDDKLDVIWCSTNALRKASPGMRLVLARMVFLETMPIAHLERERQKEFRRLLGEGLKQYLSCREDPEELRTAESSALASFAEAERRINTWNFEYTTRWYALASICTLALVALLVFVVSLLHTYSLVTWELTQFGFAGALGGMLFFLVRLRTSAPGDLRAEVSGGKVSYFTTVAVKIAVAMIGAIVIGAAMKAELLLGVANKPSLTAMPQPFTISAAAFVVCFVAGFSESLVPRFLTTFENTNVSGGTTSDSASVSK